MSEVPLYRVDKVPRYLVDFGATVFSGKGPQDHPRSLGTGLLQGPAGAVFLISEVPLYPCTPVPC